jgi:hypothetical protein
LAGDEKSEAKIKNLVPLMTRGQVSQAESAFGRTREAGNCTDATLGIHHQLINSFVQPH